MKLILASASPRRSEVLALAGFEYTIRAREVNEQLKGQHTPEDFVKHLAMKKALAVPCGKDEVVLGADTVVVFDGEIFGKPRDNAHAIEMLSAFSGKTHSVFTGVALITGSEKVNFSAETKVSFYEITNEEILSYVLSGEPAGKAGSYAVQGKGCVFVREIIGEYFNVVGLPVARLALELKRLGIKRA